MANLRISPLEERHIAAVVAIERASQSCPWSEESFRNEIGHERGIFIVGELGSEVVGYAGQWIIVDEAHIITVAVAEPHRRQGFAEKLIVELLLTAKAKGASCATLEVRASNAAAQALYKKLGFADCGRRRNYYPDNKEDAVIMWLYGLQEWDR